MSSDIIRQQRHAAPTNWKEWRFSEYENHDEWGEIQIEGYVIEVHEFEHEIASIHVEFSSKWGNAGRIGRTRWGGCSSDNGDAWEAGHVRLLHVLDTVPDTILKAAGTRQRVRLRAMVARVDMIDPAEQKNVFKGLFDGSNRCPTVHKITARRIQTSLFGRAQAWLAEWGMWIPIWVLGAFALRVSIIPFLMK